MKPLNTSIYGSKFHLIPYFIIVITVHITLIHYKTRLKKLSIIYV